MADFKSMEALNKFLKSVVYDALDTDVADVIKDYESASAKSVVYSAYSPKSYPRRMSLADKENMIHNVDGNLTLTVENKAQFNDVWATKNSGDGLAELVEYGNGGGGHSYEYFPRDKEATFAYPRPFISTAREEIKPEIKDLMRQALINQGLTVD